MITSGQPTDSSATKTEVVNVVSGETCPDFADFPLQNYRAVGANLHETPVLCGGSYYSETHQTSTWYQNCYKLTDAGWKEFAIMKEKRYAAAGVVYKNKFHIFGGHKGSNRLQTSELISIYGVVEDGPALQEAVEGHAITSVNSKVSILTGGSTSANYYSPKTWYFNHETGAFSSGPPLVVGRTRHGSATIVDKVTNAKISIVTAGDTTGNDPYLDSTELLINEQWQLGTIPFKKAICFDLL